MERFSPLTVNWSTLSFSILPQILLLGMNQKALTVGLGTVPLADWLVIGYLIVFATALGQQAWLYGVQGIGPSRAGVFVNLVPVSALVLSALLLGEQIGLTEVAGIVLVLAGVWLVNRQSARAKE
jgi:drug/metabolite transporter (DMT)-like permease